LTAKIKGQSQHGRRKAPEKFEAFSMWFSGVFGGWFFPQMRAVHSPEMTRYAARITMQNQDRRAVANKKYIFTFMTAI